MDTWGVKIRRSALSGYSADGYIEDLNSIVFLIMIEKNIAVDNIDEILTAAKEKGVDMTQWGPADFGFSRGEPNLMNTTGDTAVRRTCHQEVNRIRRCSTDRNWAA